jgi:DNA-binding transcriptional regulator YdaS (Cro superfamily)
MEANPIATAVQKLGGARAASVQLEVSVQLVYFWLSGQRRFPAEKCPVVERLTNGQIRCEALRPDVEWSVLREQAVA